METVTEKKVFDRKESRTPPGKQQTRNGDRNECYAEENRQQNEIRVKQYTTSESEIEQENRASTSEEDTDYREFREGPPEQENREVDTVAKRINNIQKLFDTILAAKTKDSEGKIQFNKKEQSKVWEAIFELQSNMIQLAYDTAKAHTLNKILNRENIVLKKQLKELKENLNTYYGRIEKIRIDQKRDIEKLRKEITKEKDKKEPGKLSEQTRTQIETYTSIILGENSETETENEATAHEEEKRRSGKLNIATGYNTPKNEPGWQILIRKKGKKEEDSVKELDVQVQGSDFEVKERNLQQPMIRITGIDKGYTDEEFIEEFVRQNKHIWEEKNYLEIKNNIQVIARKTCRNERRENIILKARADIFKLIMKSTDLAFDLLKVYAEEYLQIALCYRCCLYGHVAKHCRATKGTCYKCASTEHEANKCQGNELLRCINCRRLKIGGDGHSARDRECPVYKRKVEEIKEYK